MLKRVVSVMALGLLGVVVAAIGAGSHRSAGYLGVGLTLVLFACAGVFAKAWQSWSGFIVFAVLWVGVTTVFAVKGPGESTLVADDLKDHLWLFGGAVVLSIIAALPRFVLVGSDVAP